MSWQTLSMPKSAPPIPLTPVVRRSLSDAVFEQLRLRIVSGDMPPGSTLPAERSLCEALGVNRSSVREALRRLQQAGLVAVRQGGASQVLDYRGSAGLDLLETLLFTPNGQLDPEVIRSVLQLRSVIAPDVARLAARRPAPPLASRLEAIVAAMDGAAGDLDRLQSLALDYWDLAVTASGNVAYRLAYNSLRRVYDRCRELLQAVLADELTDRGNYAAIAAAVRRGDGAAAETRARVLIRRGETAIEAALKRLDRAQRKAS